MSFSTASRFLNTSRDSDSTTSLGSLFQGFTMLSEKKFFLTSNLNPPPAPVQLETIPSSPIASYVGEEADSPSLHNASLEPPLLPEQSRFLPHKTCAPDPSPAFLPFSECTPEPQCLSCSEEPKTGYSTQGAASPVLSMLDCRQLTLDFFSEFHTSHSAALHHC